MKKLYGVGVNDADYQVSGGTGGICPYYTRWRHILKRGYDPKSLIKNPSYEGCSVAEEWHKFSEFRKWMLTQRWARRQIDKDILVPGNKIYSSETCVFVTLRTNTFIIDRKADRGSWPLGVYQDKQSGKFKAQCCTLNGERKYLGLYETPEAAHEAWRQCKYEQALLLASQQDDARVAEALRIRYLPGGGYCV